MKSIRKTKIGQGLIINSKNSTTSFSTAITLIYAIRAKLPRLIAPDLSHMLLIAMIRWMKCNYLLCSTHYSQLLYWNNRFVIAVPVTSTRAVEYTVVIERGEKCHSIESNPETYKRKTRVCYQYIGGDWLQGKHTEGSSLLGWEQPFMVYSSLSCVRLDEVSQ